MSVAISARTQADVERTAKEIAAQTKAEVTPFVGDMSKPEEIERLLDNVRSRLGEPDIVVCNAGGPPPGISRPPRSSSSCPPWSSA